jgi:hypothetical protein
MVEHRAQHCLLIALEDPDPLRGLEAVGELQHEVDQMAAVLVRRARNAGCTWAQVAAALGVSRQAVHKRYGR